MYNFDDFVEETKRNGYTVQKDKEFICFSKDNEEIAFPEVLINKLLQDISPKNFISLLDKLIEEKKEGIDHLYLLNKIYNSEKLMLSKLSRRLEEEGYETLYNPDKKIILFRQDDLQMGMDANDFFEVFSSMNHDTDSFINFIEEKFNMQTNSNILELASRAIMDIEYTKKHFFPYAINLRKHKDFLETVPYIPYGDFAICFKVFYEPEENADPLITDITNDMLEKYGISILDFVKWPTPISYFSMPLFYDYENPERIFRGDFSLNDNKKVVVTNVFNTYGAIIILDLILLNEIYKKEGAFFVKFLNTDEAIIVKATDSSLRYLQEEMIYESEDAPEYLSNEIYIFDENGLRGFLKE